MTIKITGINGYIGQLISKHLQDKGYNVRGIKRQLLYGETKHLKDEIKGCDVIINLAGAPILQRWTNRNKKKIYDSRIECTKNLIRAINDLPAEERPSKFISASAIGIYQSGLFHNENSTNFDNSFVGTVTKDWESALDELPASTQLNVFRIGLVLGKEAKTIKNLITPFKLGLGGKVGSGKQAFPFIHEKDLLDVFVWAIENLNENKIFNLVAPQQITNSEFTQTFARKIKRPAFIPIPRFMIKLILGEASSLLLESPKVTPQNLLDAGYNFMYPTIDAALSEILT
jgi:uncharacterized protein (TIGR01777 family)